MGKLPNTQSRTTRPGRVNLWINGLALFLIVLATASLVFISYLASRQADHQAIAYEKSLFEHAQEELDLRTAQNIATLAYWDEAVQRIVHDFDEDFVRNEFLNYFWDDFEIERTYIIAPDDTVIAKAFRDYTSVEAAPLLPGSAIKRIADRSRTRYEELKIPIAGGFGVSGISYYEIGELAKYTVGFIDGLPAHFVAMPILPDQGEVALGDGPPHVVVTIRYIDRQYVDILANKLSFDDLRFQKGVPPPDAISIWPLLDHENKPRGYFSWSSRKPGKVIWEFVVPVIILLITAITAIAFVAVFKATGLVNSLEKSERLNHFNARHDPLTGLANRFQFNERMDLALAALPGTGFALIICDLDHFKDINDTYGHIAGDTVICVIAERLKNATGPNGLVARSGGDEFVILTGTTDVERLAVLCDTIVERVSKPVAIPPNTSVRVGISLGVAIAPACGTTETRLLTAADNALYTAKNSGRGTYSIACGPVSGPVVTTPGGNAAA